MTTSITMNYYFAAVSGLILPLVGGFLIRRTLKATATQRGRTSAQSAESPLQANFIGQLLSWHRW
jgi:p-aminobenzoyl-glutamate transporter AbgT